MQVPVNLVTSEYYKDELAYQQIIDESRNAGRAGSKIIFEQDNHFLTMEFLRENQKSGIVGEINFYCPSDARRDLKRKIDLNDQGRQSFELSKLLPGRYTAKIRWESAGIKYYQEEPIIISNR